MSIIEHMKSTRFASLCKRAFLCLIVTGLIFAVWKLSLGSRLFFIGLRAIERINVFTAIYFVTLCLFLFCISNMIRKKRIVIVICWALVVGFVDWFVAFKIYCVWYYRNNPTINCFEFQSLDEILFWPTMALAHLSYFITLTAVLLLRLAWKINDRMTSGKAS